jgi:uncharacterized OsmC-like protein
MKTKVQNNLVNGIKLDTLQETVNAIQQNPQLGKCNFRAKNKWINGNHNLSMITDFSCGENNIPHVQELELHADEPSMLSGDDEAANPVEYLLHALASCVTTSMVAHAAVRGIHIEELESEVEGDIDLRGYLGLAPGVPKGFTDIRMKFRIKSDVDNLQKLASLAEMSPVYHTILEGANVKIAVEAK